MDGFCRLCCECFVRGRVFSQVSLEVSEFTTTSVRDTLLIVFGVVDQSWVALHLDAWDFVGSAIHLCNYNIIETFNKLTKFSPKWSKTLAVTAPWGVVLDKHIFARISNNFFPGFSSNNLDWSIVRYWCWFTLKMRFQVACLEFIYERFN